MLYNPSLYKLSNGVSIILDPMDLETVSLSVSFKTGARDETAQNSGVTHFLEHMLMKGTPRFPTPQSIKDFIAINGGTINAKTNYSDISIFGRVIAENLLILADLVSDLFKNSLLDSKRIENEKSVILNECAIIQAQRDSRFYYFGTKNMFPGSGLDNETIGTPETIKSFTRRELFHFHKTRLSAKNCLIVISGKITDPATLLEKLETFFSWLPTHSVSQNSDMPKYFPVTAHNPDDDENIRLKIVTANHTPLGLQYLRKNMCIIRFSEAITKRLVQTLRHEHGLTYKIKASSSLHSHTIETNTSPKDVNKTVELVAKTSSDMMLRNKYSTKELDRFNQLAKLLDADWLESQTGRSNSLKNFYYANEQLYDYYEARKVANSLTASDIIDLTSDRFDGEISVITQGATCDPANLRKIWTVNYR